MTETNTHSDEMHSSTRSKRSYALITPCRNEAKFARKTIESVIAQTITPSRWIIVDDGSTDETASIVEEYAKRYEYIRVVRREDRGKRSVGPGVIEAFYTGYDTIDPADYEYICKFDLDLIIPPKYFEILIHRMENNPYIGTCSGKPYYVDKSGKLISEKCGDEMSVGMTKFYRTDCFKDIGGFVHEVMWDGIDCHRCRMLGWLSCSWDEPDLRFIHLRPMGASQGSYFQGRLRGGYGQYFMGTGFLYMTAVSLYRMTRPPYFVNGIGLWLGYISSILQRKKRYDDKDFVRFLKRYQIRSLIKGKTIATNELHDNIMSQKGFTDSR